MLTASLAPGKQPADTKSSNMPQNHVVSEVMVSSSMINNIQGIDDLDKQLLDMHRYMHTGRLPSIIHMPEKYDMKKVEAVGKDRLPPREEKENVKYFLLNNVRHFFSPYAFFPLAQLAQESYNEYFTRVHCKDLLAILNKNSWLWEDLENLLMDLVSNKIRLNTKLTNKNITRDVYEINEMIGFIARTFIEGNKIEELNRFYLDKIRKPAEVLHFGGNPDKFFEYTVSRQNLKSICLKWLKIKNNRDFFMDLFQEKGHLFDSAFIDKKTIKLVIEKIFHNMSLANKIVLIRQKKESDRTHRRNSDHILTIMQEDIDVLLKNIDNLNTLFPEIFLNDVTSLYKFHTFSAIEAEKELDDFKKHIRNPEVFLEKLVNIEIAIHIKNLKSNKLEEGHVFIRHKLTPLQIAINKLAKYNIKINLDPLINAIKENKVFYNVLNLDWWGKDGSHAFHDRYEERYKEAIEACKIILSKLAPSPELASEAEKPAVIANLQSANSSESHSNSGVVKQGMFATPPTTPAPDSASASILQSVKVNECYFT